MIYYRKGKEEYPPPIYANSPLYHDIDLTTFVKIGTVSRSRRSYGEQVTCREWTTVKFLNNFYLRSYRKVLFQNQKRIPTGVTIFEIESFHNKESSGIQLANDFLVITLGTIKNLIT